MSVLTPRRFAEQQVIEELVLPSTVLLPRANLLPPEIEERRHVQRVQTALGGAVLAAVGLVGLLYVGAVGSVHDAQTESDAATATAAQLQADTARYGDVTAVYARAASADTMLTQAMGEEVRWSVLLNDLSLSVPDTVWLKGATFTQTAAGAPSTTGAAGSTATGPDAPLGTVTFTGVGFSHDDVAAWLESLVGHKGLVDPTFSSSTESLLGSRKVVDFTSSATLTRAALSQRYTNPES